LLPVLNRAGPGVAIHTTLTPTALSSGERGCGEATVNGLALPAFVHRNRPAREGKVLAETDFLAQFFRVVEQRGFVFPEQDLINFRVCGKTGGLTVLAGLSGTGKSSLPRLYAEALGCRDEYLPVAVRPEWLDDRDLIGAFNPLAQRFEPA